MTNKVVVSRVKTGAGDDEVLVQAAHRLEADETHAMALPEGRNLTETPRLQREVIIGCGQSGVAWRGLSLRKTWPPTRSAGGS